MKLYFAFFFFFQLQIFQHLLNEIARNLMHEIFILKNKLSILRSGSRQHVYSSELAKRELFWRYLLVHKTSISSSHRKIFEEKNIYYLREI